MIQKYALYVFLLFYVIPFAFLLSASGDLQTTSSGVPFAASVARTFMTGPMYVIAPLLAPLFAFRSPAALGKKGNSGRYAAGILVTILAVVFLGSVYIASSLHAHDALWRNLAGDGYEDIRDVIHNYITESITNIALISGIQIWTETARKEGLADMTPR